LKLIKFLLRKIFFENFLKNESDMQIRMQNNKMKTGLYREGKEQFYTKKEVAKQCVDLVKNKKLIGSEDLVIEPSAGNGAFIPFLKELGAKTYFSDIDSQHEEIKQQDFLTLNLKLLYQDNEKLHFIGNPPFNGQSSLAKKFIQKCCQEERTQSISFILPSSFKKESMKKTFGKYFHLIDQVDLDKNSFLLDGKNYSVPCIFQIWVRQNFEREVEAKQIPKNFKFVQKKEDHDISVRRVGVYAGEVTWNDGESTKNKNINTHYFIKFTIKLSEEILQQLKKISYENNNTVGPRSISKQELTTEFNKIL
jgi:hypothetical protein